jgi:hypothetical protein
MKKIAIVAIVCLIATPVCAESRQIAMADAIAAISAIKAISAGTTKVIKEGGQDKSTPAPYDLSPATRASLAHDLIRLTDATHGPIAEMQAVIRDICPNGTERANCAIGARTLVDKEIATSEVRKIAVDIVELTEADLALDKNQIPIEVLAALKVIVPSFEK